MTNTNDVVIAISYPANSVKLYHCIVLKVYAMIICEYSTGFIRFPFKTSIMRNHASKRDGLFRVSIEDLLQRLLASE